MPPFSGNHLHFHAVRKAPNGRHFTLKTLKPVARFWRENVGLMAKLAMKKAGLKPIFREKFSVDVRIWWESRRSQCDSDGILKLPLDSLNKVVYSSDKFALPRVLGYDYDSNEPRIEMTISCPPTNLIEVELQ